MAIETMHASALGHFLRAFEKNETPKIVTFMQARSILAVAHANVCVRVHVRTHHDS